MGSGQDHSSFSDVCIARREGTLMGLHFSDFAGFLFHGIQVTHVLHPPYLLDHNISSLHLGNNK